MNQAPTKLLPQLAIFALAALIISVIFHSDMIRRMSVDTVEKIGMPLLGPRTDPGDNYHYYTYAKIGLPTCGISAGEAGESAGNTVACTYPGALLVSHALYRIAAVFAPSLRFEPAWTLILHTALLAFALLTCLASILGSRLRMGASLATGGALLFVVGNFALSFYFGYPYKYFQNIYAAEPDVIRIMNPTVFWSLGLLTLAALIHTIRSPSLTTRLAVVIGALLLGTASIAVAGTLLAGLALYLAIEWLAMKHLCRPALLCAGVLLLALSGMIWMFKIYWATGTGKAFNHGQFTGLKVNMAFLWLLLPVAIWRISPNGGAPDRLLKALLVASMMVGMLCTSVELGDRLWSRGAVIFALVCCAAWLWNLSKQVLMFGFRKLPDFRFAGSVSRVFNALLCIVAPLLLLAALLIYRPWNPDTWRGYMEHDKFEALVWLSERTTKADAIASPDINDSYVIPFYTRASALVPVFALTSVSFQEGLRRYFHVLSLLANSGEYMSRILAAEDKDIQTHFAFFSSDIKTQYEYHKFQQVGFYESLIYYPYNGLFKNVLTDPQKRKEFVALMLSFHKQGIERTYQFTYLLIRNDEPLKQPEQFDIVFRNGSYTILQPKMAKAIITPASD
ncbi:MAG: hypothetical protein A3I66_20165 [Burkholderiales bacterium RIFCSPLOWO2_02_FULL_57_36]|nr:MAG: hypothetical protein A3I66_20165 [Burkholderiales bacterium RIFCSPLOWO2_02_FULL_57_36]